MSFLVIAVSKFKKAYQFFGPTYSESSTIYNALTAGGLKCLIVAPGTDAEWLLRQPTKGIQ